jgi:hypothetical protein
VHRVDVVLHAHPGPVGVEIVLEREQERGQRARAGVAGGAADLLGLRVRAGRTAGVRAGRAGVLPDGGQPGPGTWALANRSRDQSATGVAGLRLAAASVAVQLSWGGFSARAVTALASSTEVRSMTTFGTVRAISGNWST